MAERHFSFGSLNGAVFGAWHRVPIAVGILIALPLLALGEFAAADARDRAGRAEQSATDQLAARTSALLSTRLSDLHSEVIGAARSDEMRTALNVHTGAQTGGAVKDANPPAVVEGVLTAQKSVMDGAIDRLTLLDTQLAILGQVPHDDALARARPISDYAKPLSGSNSDRIRVVPHAGTDPTIAFVGMTPGPRRLVADVPLSFISETLRSSVPSGESVRVSDQVGTLLEQIGDASPAASALSARATVSATGWRVTALRPTTAVDELDAVLWVQRAIRLGLGALLILGAIVLGRVGARGVRLTEATAAALNDTQEALDRETATSEILRIMAASPSDTQPVLDAVARAAAVLCRAPAAFVYQIEGPERLIAFYGDDTYHEMERAQHGASIRSGRARLQRLVLAERRAVHVADTAKDPEFADEDKQGAVGFHAFLGVPLMRGAEVIGTIQVCRIEAEAFSDEQIALLVVFADQAAIAIENVRLFNEIEQKSRELEATSRHKSEFLANMSHELRTPLNAVIGFADVLEQRLFGSLNERQSEYVRDISSSGRHLLDLVNEILDLSKVEAGKMTLEPSEFAPADTIHGALAFVRERAARHGIELAAEVPSDLGTITADERKVRQVLLNLLSNAVKFTPDGGWIGVSARRADGELTVSVRDTGIGIALADQPRVFEEFQQVGKADARSREGTGLGLTLAKRFVELHGGRIWLTSVVGEGSTFTFALPVDAGRATARPSSGLQVG